MEFFLTETHVWVNPKHVAYALVDGKTETVHLHMIDGNTVVATNRIEDSNELFSALQLIVERLCELIQHGCYQ